MPGQVGPALAATSAQPLQVPRVAKTTEAAVQQAHGKYYEAASNGVLFAACEQGTGVTPPTSLSTTALISLYNPPGSGKRLSLVKVAIGYISGTMDAGTLYHCVNNNPNQTAPSGGTTLTVLCSDVGNKAAGVGLAGVGTTVVAPVAYRPFVTLDEETAASTAPFQQVTDDMDGELVIEPGCTYQIQGKFGASAGSPLVTVGISWEEIPIVT